MDDAAINAWCRAVDAVIGAVPADAQTNQHSLHFNGPMPPALGARAVLRHAAVPICHHGTGRGHRAISCYDIDGNERYGVIVSEPVADDEVMPGERHDPRCPHFVAPSTSARRVG